MKSSPLPLVLLIVIIFATISAAPVDPKKSTTTVDPNHVSTDETNVSC